MITSYAAIIIKLASCEIQFRDDKALTPCVRAKVRIATFICLTDGDVVTFPKISCALLKLSEKYVIFVFTTLRKMEQITYFCKITA